MEEFLLWVLTGVTSGVVSGPLIPLTWIPWISSLGGTWSPTALDALKLRIEEEVNRIPSDMIRRAQVSVSKRAHLYVQNNGGYFEKKLAYASHNRFEQTVIYCEYVINNVIFSIVLVLYVSDTYYIINPEPSHVTMMKMEYWNVH